MYIKNCFANIYKFLWYYPTGCTPTNQTSIVISNLNNQTNTGHIWIELIYNSRQYIYIYILMYLYINIYIYIIILVYMYTLVP